MEGKERRLGPYRLLRRVGRGGFADVWLAERDTGGGKLRQVALKLVDTTEGPREGMRPDALLREARLVAQLRAPSIVGVEAADIEGDIVWMAMDYCDGGSVATLLQRLGRRGLPMPPAVALHIAQQVALALGVAHGATDAEGEPMCVVHRDLKPGNVLLTTEGEVKVCDFGIAKATDETNVTGTGLLKGTASYVAPELWQNVRAFSPASDAFALGTLLVELLTMKRLHAGGAMSMVYRRIVEGSGSTDASRAEPFCPPVVPLLEALLMRDPDERLYDMAAVASQLAELLKPMPGPADPGLLLRLLDHAEGRAPSPTGMPLRVSQAWQHLVQTILRVDLLPADGSGGADTQWELAVQSPAEDLEPPTAAVTGFGPPELRTSSDSLAAVGGPDAQTVPFRLQQVTSDETTHLIPTPEQDPRTSLWRGPVGGRAPAPPRPPPDRRPPSDGGPPADRRRSSEGRRPPDREERRRAREADDTSTDTTAMSYTDLSPASQVDLPPMPAPNPKRRPRRRRRPIPWALIAAGFVLWSLLVAVFVALVT